MVVVDPQKHGPDADPRPPIHDDPLTESWLDPLGEFAPEPSAPRERLLQFASEPPPPRERIQFEPDWQGPGEWDRQTERASAPAEPSLSRAAAQPSSGRWLVGAVMLAVGLVAGLAAGVALVTWSGSDRNQAQAGLALAENRPDENRATSEIPPAPVPSPPPAQPPAKQPAGDPPLAAPRGVPVRRAVATPPTSRKPVETIPSATTALYVQSDPSGAEVYLDDKLVSTTPFQLSDIAPGAYTLRIDMQGYRIWSAPVSVQQGVRTTVSAVLAR